MKGEHAEGAADPLVRRALELRGTDRTRHRPRLGGMSVSLLNELMTDHLDGGYAAAARRPDRMSPARSRAVLALGLLLVGLVLAAAYRGTIRNAPESERARQALVRDVEAGAALTDELRRRAETLSGQLVRERDTALTTSRDGDRAGAELRLLEVAAAQRPVKGPGVSVVAGDAAPSTTVDPGTGQRVPTPAEDNGRLRDRDLQSLVNALWAAGAEAVAVDGERLAPVTTIRAAGEAILVDLRPVQSPYTIEAIGDPATLLPRFADSETARRFQSWTGLYGIQFTVREVAELRLRGGTGPDLRYASPVPTATPDPPAATPGPSVSGPGASGSAAPGSSTPGGSAPGGSASPAPPSGSPSGPAPSGPPRWASPRVAGSGPATGSLPGSGGGP